MKNGISGCEASNIDCVWKMKATREGSIFRRIHDDIRAHAFGS
jgi:hypothetical protein